jgi:2-oxoglutarate ferredoxin oxidoreductase subunit gamma
MRQEIRICGFGGQGVITGAVILGKAAAVYDGKIACQTQSYGPEARGGAASAMVVISDGPIGYPGVHAADVLVAMSQEAFTRYSREVNPDSIIIVDPDTVFNYDAPQTIYPVRSTKIAEDLGNVVVANIVMLGALTALSGVVSTDAILAATLASVPTRFTELNRSALESGIAAGLSFKI